MDHPLIVMTFNQMQTFLSPTCSCKDADSGATNTMPNKIAASGWSLSNLSSSWLEAVLPASQTPYDRI